MLSNPGTATACVPREQPVYQTRELRPLLDFTAGCTYKQWGVWTITFPPYDIQATPRRCKLAITYLDHVGSYMPVNEDRNDSGLSDSAAPLGLSSSNQGAHLNAK